MPLTLDVGVRPTVISREEFDNRDFGYPVELTSQVGLDWEFYRGWKLGYRFQHMSNAGLGASNPGLNTHIFSLACQF